MAANNGGDFWGKGSDGNKDNQPAGGVWESAQKARQSAAADAGDPSGVAARKRSRRLKIILATFSVLAIGGGTLVLFAPKIAGAFAPGIIASRAGGFISGEASVESVNLSWTGPQTIEKLRILDKKKEVVALSLSTDAGLFGLITGNLDLGKVTVTGARADLVRDKNGELNLQRIFAPPSAPGSGPAPAPSSKNAPAPTLPEGLKAELVIKNLAVEYTDLSAEHGANVKLDDLDLTSSIEAGKPLTLKLKGKAADAANSAEAGSIIADVNIDKWSKEDGSILLKRAKITSKIEIADLPVALLDAFVVTPAGAPRPQLVAGLGNKLNLVIDVDGSLGDMLAKLNLTTSGAQAAADIKWADGVLTAAAPITASLKGPAIPALVVAVREGLAAQDAAKLDALPDLALRIDNLRIPFDPNKDLDLRTGAATVTLSATRTTGTLRLAPDQPAKPFALSPLNIKVESADLAKALAVNARTDLTIDGSPAGEITLDVNTGGLLTPAGAVAQGLPPDLRGSLVVHNIATAILQPFVQSAGLEMGTDIGPTLDVEMTAKAGDAQGAPVPPTDVELKVTSRELSAIASLSVLNEGIESKVDGVRIDLNNVARLASRFVKPETGWEIVPAPGSTATIVVQGLALPRNTKTGAYALDQLRARTALTMQNVSARSRTSDGEPIDVRMLNISTDVTTGAVRMGISGQLGSGQRGFTIDGDFNVPGVITAPRTLADGTTSVIADPASLRPVGTLGIHGVPVSLTSLFVPPKTDQATGRTEDLGALLGGVVGETVELTINSQPLEGSGGYEFGVNAKAERLSAGIGAQVSSSQIALRSLLVRSTIDQPTVSALLHQFAPNINGTPRLLGETQVEISAAPITIPLDSASKPVWQQAGAASVTIEAKGRTTVDGLRLKEADGTMRDLGRVGVDGLKITATSPLAIIMGTGQPGARTATLTVAGKVIGPANTDLCTLAVNASAELDTAKPAGPATASIKLTGLDTRQLETVLGQDGLYSGALGGRASLDVDAKLTPPPASSGAFDVAAATIDITTNFQASNLETNGPLKAVISPASISIIQPAKFTLRVDPQIANTLLKSKPKPGEPAPSASSQLTMTEAATLNLTIDSLNLPRTGGGKFEVKTALQTAALALRDGDGKNIRLTNMSFRAATDNSKPSPPLTFALDIASAAVDQFATDKPLKLQGVLENIVDAKGALDIKKGTLSLGGDLKGIPTALVDALSKKDGMLVDALGPTVDVMVSAEKVPLEGLGGKSGPQIRITANSARASANITGGVSENVFNSSGPVTVSVVEITKALAQRYISSVPVVETLEKVQGQRPATITGNDLTIPLNNDMSRLNGTVVLDPGEINFQMSSGFGKLVSDKVLKQKGVVGQKLEPVNTAFTNGVGHLQRYKFPLGEFTLELEGDVDLVKERVDIVTWIPVTLLADEAIGGLAGVLPGGANPLLKLSDFTASVRELIPLVPYRTKGPMNAPNPSLVPDGKLLAQEFERNGGWQKVLQRMISGRGGDLLDGLLKPPAPKPAPPK